MSALSVYALTKMVDTPNLDQFNTLTEDQRDTATGFFAFSLGLILFILAVAIVVFAVWVWAIVDAAQRPTSQWEAAGQNKTIWIVVLVGGAVVGFMLIVTIVYFVWPRPRLKRAAPSPAY